MDSKDELGKKIHANMLQEMLLYKRIFQLNQKERKSAKKLTQHSTTFNRSDFVPMK